VDAFRQTSMATGLGMPATRFSTDPDNGQAQCEEDLDECLAEPAFLDEDADGEHDLTDACPATAEGVAVDSAGCSLEQFCSAFYVGTGLGPAGCIRADWKNNQPSALAIVGWPKPNAPLALRRADSASSWPSCCRR
jgi:hypothetical protein